MSDIVVVNSIKQYCENIFKMLEHSRGNIHDRVCYKQKQSPKGVL